MSCSPPLAFSACLGKEVPAYLSLPWTGLLVCRGVEGPDSSEEALHWASRGDRGRVLCPLGPSLQDTGSGDSAGKGRREAVSQNRPSVWLSSFSLCAFPTILQDPPLPWALPTQHPLPADVKGPAGARCPGSGYLSPPSSAGIS